MHKLPFRQVHLDFHTSPHIPEIGAKFDKKEWQETLKEGHISSITLFAKCHHGWSYHPTKVGRMHPHLHFDLLRAQFDATKELGINAPIYISAGVDNLASYEHPEWREVDPQGRYTGWAKSILEAGFHKLCFNSPYMDYLERQIIEVVRLFPNCDGIFLDIIYHGDCCCRWCLEWMDRYGLNPENPDDRRKASELALERYYQRTTAACRIDNPNMPVFHNSGHVQRGQRKNLRYFSHLELESLPTGGWGYDHFPLSARYVQQLGLDFLGMTGKFHLSWGEFGGYKHPNALRYECAAMLAHGAKCSVGDQLHPNGRLEPATYKLIGEAYAEVEQKEPWCTDVSSIAEIGVLSSQAINADYHRESHVDNGVCRVLSEEHLLFDVLDRESELGAYRLLILPDDLRIDQDLKSRLVQYVEQGGSILCSGKSGLDAENQFIFDFGAVSEGPSPFEPDYMLPAIPYRCDFAQAPVVCYYRSQRIKVTDGESLGEVYDPYFNRTWRHFCSHRHTPYQPNPSGYALGVRKGRMWYLAHPLFSLYYAYGMVAYRQFLGKVIRAALQQPILTTNLPSGARVTLQHQIEKKRVILHLLYAPKYLRGTSYTIGDGTLPHAAVEVIEELIPLRNIKIQINLPYPVKSIHLQPQGKKVPFGVSAPGQYEFSIEEFTCHQMVEFKYD